MLKELMPKKKLSMVLGSNKDTFIRCIIAACVAQVTYTPGCHARLLCVTFDHTFRKPARNDNNGNQRLTYMHVYRSLKLCPDSYDNIEVCCRFIF